MTSADVHAPLPIDDLRRARAAARIGHTLHYLESVDSTNTLAQRLADEGAAEGTVVIAETQTKGRGRLGRTWVSPPYRNLYASIVLRPPIATRSAPQITLVAGVAAVEAMSDWVARAALKWPNDVLIDGKKVAGILTEMQADGAMVRFVILGIGVNLNATADDFPADLQDKASALGAVAGRPIDRLAFAERLLACLEERYELFLRQGFAAIRPLWESRSCLTGRRVQIDGGEHQFQGTVTGIADDGALLLRDAGGDAIRVVAGDVTIVTDINRATSRQRAIRSASGKEGADS